MQKGVSKRRAAFIKRLLTSACFLLASIGVAQAAPTEIIGSYSVQYAPTVGNGPTITKDLATPFTEFLNVGVTTTPTNFLAVSPASSCGWSCGWSNTATGTISVNFSFTDPTTNNSVSDTGAYFADYWNDTDAVTWNKPDPLVVDFTDGAILDINLINAQDWTIYPKISFDLVQGPTSVPEPSSIALMFGGLLAATIALGALRRRREGTLSA